MLYSIFKRKTTSTSFIAEIDGLRFLAILMVVVEHIQGFYVSQINLSGSLIKINNPLHFILSTGRSGVLLFFGISGFILMLPFARHYLLKKERVPLDKYYLRRLVRLEPPYFLALILIFLLVTRKVISWEVLFPHLGASLFYLHYFFYKAASLITPVAWSLEVEVQFYLMVPVLAHIYRLSPGLRRGIILAVIAISPLIQELLKLPQETFLGVIQYFAVGFILADLYATGDWPKMARGIPWLGGILLASLILTHPTMLLGKFLYPFFIVGFYYFVLTTDFWKGIFRNKVLTSIGGMCYTIYLLHFNIIFTAGKRLFNFKVTDSYAVNLGLQMMMHMAVILFLCSIYYLLVEKPFQVLASRLGKKRG